MNTEPKPTGEWTWRPCEPCGQTGINENCPDCDGEGRIWIQPKPATGELPDINEIVVDLRQATGSPENLHRAFFNILQPIYDKHNAALVAERENHRKEMEAVTMNTSDIETVQQLRAQLAAAQAAQKPLVDALTLEIEKLIDEGKKERASFDCGPEAYCLYKLRDRMAVALAKVGKQ